MNTSTNSIEQFFGVLIQGKTYRNMLYLALAFPLGLFYFIFLVVGLSLGVGLTIVWVGLLILALVIGGWYALILFERQMAINLLGEKLPPVYHVDTAGKTLWQKFTITLGDPLMWKGLAFLLLKFPLGIVAFTLLVTFLTVSLTLIAAPLYYSYADVLPIQVTWWNGVNATSTWIIDTGFEASMACLIGLLLLPISAYVFNGLAWVFAKLSSVLLTSAQPVAIPAPAPVAAPAAAPIVPTEPAPAVPAAPAPEPPSSFEDHRSN